jgi:hypothetical protein
MTAQELMDTVRLILSDELGVSADQLWTDTELLEYANDAQKEASIRARLLVDSATAAIANVTMIAGTAIYTLDTRVIDIIRAKVVGTTNPALYQTTKTVLDLTDDDWESTSGIPRSYIFEEISAHLKKLQLYPNPAAPGTLNLTVVRLPLADMAVGDEPEIQEHLHSDLKFWMVYRAFQKQDTKVNQDAKTVGLTKEKFYLGEFEKVFGARTAIAQEFEKSALLV